jgi:hypothetical protein
MQDSDRSRLAGSGLERGAKLKRLAKILSAGERPRLVVDTVAKAGALENLRLTLGGQSPSCIAILMFS